ncbi:MAG: hypothetical protein ACRDQ5_23360 [Sciscionella sp.]
MFGRTCLVLPACQTFAARGRNAERELPGAVAQVRAGQVVGTEITAVNVAGPAQDTLEYGHQWEKE